MQYRNLGSAGVKVSPLMLGCAMFGAVLDENELRTPCLALPLVAWGNVACCSPARPVVAWGIIPHPSRDYPDCGAAR